MFLKKLWFLIRDGVRFQAAKARYDFHSKGNIEDLNFHDFKHIVILKTDGKLGDTEVMSHFYRNLQALEPRPFLTVICPKNLIPVYKDVLGFDNVLESIGKPSFSEINSLCDTIIEGYRSYCDEHSLLIDDERPCVDLVVTTEPHFRPRDFIFNYLLRPNYIAGCETKVHSVNYLIYDPGQITPKVSECFNTFMRAGHLEPSPVAYVPFITEESLRRMLNHMGLYAQDHPRYIVGINPLASSRDRSFSKETTAKLIALILSYQEQFKDKELFVMLLCPPQATEYKNDINSSCDKSHLLQLPPHSSVIDYSSAIHCLDALVTVDTAAVHMACASEVPQICFYTGTYLTEFKRWVPIGSQVTIVREEGVPVMALPYEKIHAHVEHFMQERVQEELKPRAY